MRPEPAPKAGRGAAARPAEPLSTASAVDAAVAVAREHGLAVERPRVLSETNNVLIALEPAPVVARVTKKLAPIRPNAGGDHLRREVELASFVHARGGPVVAPSAELPLGPHFRGGHWLSFWERAEGEVRASVEEAAPLLRELHRLIEDFDSDLRVMSSVLDDVPPLLRAARAGGGIDAEGAALIERRLGALAPTLADPGPGLPLRPLHGDPHVGNLLHKDGRPLWNDLEDCCLGPVQWDLVVLLRRVEGEAAAGVLTAYGADIEIDPSSLAAFEEARLIQAAAWLGLLCVEDDRWRRERDHNLGDLAGRESRERAR